MDYINSKLSYEQDKDFERFKIYNKPVYEKKQKTNFDLSFTLLLKELGEEKRKREVLLPYELFDENAAIRVSEK